MIIYKITNMVNGMAYVGQTTTTLKKRIDRYYEKRCMMPIAKDMRKYGRENFKIEIIYENIKTKEELDALEIKAMKEHNTLIPNGYNIRVGGARAPMAESTKKKLSKKLKGREIKYGYKISETLKEKWMDNEFREYMISTQRHKHGKYKDGIIRPKLRKQIDLDSFKSDYLSMPVSELAKKYGMQQSTVYNWIRREWIQKRGKISNTAKDPKTGKFCKSE